jgi:hypothetical protein
VSARPVLRFAPVLVGILVAAALAAAFLIGRASGADEPAAPNARLAEPLERGTAALRTPGLERAPALPQLRRERPRKPKSKPAAPRSTAPDNGGNAPAPDQSTAPPSSPRANPPKDGGGNSGGNDGGGSEGRTIIH